MLKKITLLVLVALVVLSAAVSASAATIALEIDGEKVKSDVAPYLDETGTTLVPLRVISERMPLCTKKLKTGFTNPLCRFPEDSSRGCALQEL